MSEPLFSVVVPTRNRANTLASCLKTCVDQDFNDYEVIVSDNFSTPDTRIVVEQNHSPLIRYVRTDAPLAMSHNWEFALSQTRGTYVTFLGDDDGLMPYALREIATLIADYKEPDAIHWKCGYYYWPTIAVRSAANLLILPTDRSVRLYSGRSQLLRAARNEISFDELPTIYHSFIHRRLISKHIKRVGCMFPTASPDLYSAYVFSFLAPSYISTTLPMHINGASGSSTGVASATRLDGVNSAEGDTTRIHAEFNKLSDDAGFFRHPTVPNCDLWPAFAADAFQHAKDSFFPNDDELSLDRRDMVRRYIRANVNRDPITMEFVRNAVRQSIVDQPDLVDWFDGEIQELESQPADRHPIRRPDRFGFDGNYLLLDTKPFSINDIASAVEFASHLLQIPLTGAVYDLQDRVDISIDLENTLKDLQETRASLSQRSGDLEAALGELEQLRLVVVRRSADLEATLTDVQFVRETLIDRTNRLENALAECQSLRTRLAEYE